MMRMTGTLARGIRTPMINRGDDLAQIVVDCVLAAAKEENFTLNDKDVVGVTEAVVARAQNNYATSDQIAEDIRAKFPSGVVGAVFPIFSRNRFGNHLSGIVKGCDKLYLMLSYPSDEVGNSLFDDELLSLSDVNPYSDVLDEKTYRKKFGYDNKHIFTGIDYVEFYKSFGENIEIIFANDVRSILDYTKNVLCCDIHTRFTSKRLLLEAGAEIVYGLDDVLSKPVNGSGYNEKYGLLGANSNPGDTLKLFPRDCDKLIDEISAKLKKATGKQIEVMVYGDGAFKDPVGKIWELADPVVSPAFTAGLEGTPNELKLKFLLDDKLAGVPKSEQYEAVVEAIKTKSGGSLGTTPRRYTDLLGSLCDLISGSGDKGTPVVLIQGYFDNYAS
ncbi:MAG: coenzyme F420-0:L-glutamate ligase [Eubacteriaceae bacterium]|nr:coenzyme F420-0:L-glutamate ligase [Eubacteriaceae bacterium]